MSYTIDRAAFDDLRAHAASAKPGYEIGGLLSIDSARIVGYERLENLATVPGWFEPSEIPRPPLVLVHTHPGRRFVGLSGGDAEWMRAHFRPLAVFAPDFDRLNVYWLDTTQPAGFRRFPVSIEPRPRSRARPPRRPGRRG